jgi:hypothetical protein
LPILEESFERSESLSRGNLVFIPTRHFRNGS